MVKRLQREVLTHVEAVSLAKDCPDYTSKLEMLSRTKSYNNNIEASFLGKNLCNTLTTLGEKFPHLAGHHIGDKNTHPIGPGAKAFLDLRRK